MGLIFKIAVLVLYFFVQRFVKSSNSSGTNLVLSSFGDLPYADAVIKREGDDLVLTCQIRGDNKPNTFVWNFLPMHNISSMQLHSSSNGLAILSNVSKSHLQQDDSGVYICSSPPYSAKKHVLVQPKKSGCARGGLSCGARCVLADYLCDGHRDCALGEDEEPLLCGPKPPCAGANRINCSSGRCIPEAACSLDRNEYQPHPCCEEQAKLLRGQNLIDDDDPTIIEDRRTDDFGFFQSTIYTVTACALIFLVAVVVLVSAVCRMHMKRSQLQSHSYSPAYFSPSSERARRFTPCCDATRLIQVANRYHSNPSPNSSTQGSPIRAQFISPPVIEMEEIRSRYSLDENDISESRVNTADVPNPFSCNLNLNLSRFHIAFPNAVLTRTGPRPDTPNVEDIQFAPSCHIIELSNDHEQTHQESPPPYSAIANPVGPPPIYISEDDLTHDQNGNASPTSTQNELPPNYDDVANIIPIVDISVANANAVANSNTVATTNDVANTAGCVENNNLK